MILGKSVHTTCPGPPFLFAWAFFDFAGVFFEFLHKRRSQGCSLTSLGWYVSAIRTRVGLWGTSKHVQILPIQKGYTSPSETFLRVGLDLKRSAWHLLCLPAAFVCFVRFAPFFVRCSFRHCSIWLPIASCLFFVCPSVSAAKAASATVSSRTCSARVRPCAISMSCRNVTGKSRGQTPYSTSWRPTRPARRSRFRVLLSTHYILFR